MTIGVPKGQTYAQHRERMGIERAQRNAANRKRITDFWADVFYAIELHIFVAQNHNHMHNITHENPIQKTGH
jgi:hypothetical protein